MEQPDLLLLEVFLFKALREVQKDSLFLPNELALGIEELLIALWRDFFFEWLLCICLWKLLLLLICGILLREFLFSSFFLFFFFELNDSEVNVLELIAVIAVYELVFVQNDLLLLFLILFVLDSLRVLLQVPN